MQRGISPVSAPLTRPDGGAHTAAVGRLGIGVLGPLTVDGNAGGLAPRDRVVLAALALRPGEVVSAETLADALWGGQPPTSWKKVVPGCVMRLRRVVGADSIETVLDGYRLVVPGDEVDARQFERLARRAQELLTLGEPERSAHLASEALGLWRGHALGDLDGWDAGHIEATRLEELRRDTEELYLDASLRAGRYREVLGEAQARLAEAPLRERRWGLLATAQYQAGRQGEALRTLHRARTVLSTELGIDPGPDLVALELAILRQDPSLTARELRAEPTATCPYPGLVPYDEGDADRFFGRDSDLTTCLRRLATVGVLAVVGPSGSGKSSLVRAGVAAALVRDGRHVEIVTPGAHPMDALSNLSYLSPDVVLIVDQCEQAVSLCSEPDEALRFFAALAEHGLRAPLVVAMRADRLSDATAQPGFARLVERGLHLLGPMTATDLRAAIEGPARIGGLLLEAGLVDLLVREVEGEPGALPLLSHALRQTWERREGRTLTVAGYQASGGIRGAIARTAEEVYEHVPADQRADLRDLLMRLVDSTVDGDPVSTPVPRQNLATDPEHERLVDLLVDARLVTSDRGFVELSHESLARAWPRLRGWLDDDTEGQRILRHLAGAADAWDSMGRPETELYRGVRLRTTLDWQARTRPTLTAAEREFLDEARRSADVEATRHHRSRRRRRRFVAAVTALVVVAMIAGLLAVQQADRARDAAVAADAHRADALSRDAAAVDQALLLGVEAVRLQDSRETRASLLTALARSPALIAMHQLDIGAPTPDVSLPVATMTPGGEVVIASSGGQAVALDADTLDVVHTFDSPPAAVVGRPGREQIAVSARTFAAYGPPRDLTTAAAPVLLLDPTTFEPEAVQLGGWPSGQTAAEAGDLYYSADGSHLAAELCVLRDWNVWDFSCTAIVWALAAPEQPVAVIPIRRAWAIALGADGSELYVGSYEKPALEVYDVATGALLRSKLLTPDLQVGNHAEANTPGDTLELSPDGSTVAVRDHNEVVLLDAATLTERTRLTGQAALIQALEFSHDGTRLASGADNGGITIWTLGTGRGVEHLRSHTGSVRAISFSPDDAKLYSAATDSRLLAWDLRGDRRSMPRLATAPDPDTVWPDGIVPTLAIPAPEGRAVVYFGQTPGPVWGNALRFFDAENGRLSDVVVTEHLNVPAWRPPDYEDFVTADLEGVIHVWDWRSGTQRFERRVSSAGIVSLTYTPDGEELVVLDRTLSIVRVDADTLEPIGAPIALDEEAAVDDLSVTVLHDALTVSPDGRTAVALLAAGTSAVVDLAKGRVVRRGDLGLEPARAQFSPDGERLAVVSGSGEVGLQEVDSGRWIRGPVRAHDGGVGAAWAPDGSVFVSYGTDGQLGVWDGRTGDRLGMVAVGDPGVFTIASFLPDGHTLVIGLSDDRVFTWDTRVETWIEQACKIAGRNLTLDEWSEAFGSRPYRPTCPAD